MRNKLWLISSFLLLSCASKNAPEELVSYLNACSLDKAKENTKTIVYSLENVLSQEKELGRIHLTLEYDNSKEDFYEYQKEEYSSSYVVFNSDVSLYVTEMEKQVFLKENYYYVYTTYKGYPSLGEKEESKTLPPVKYQKENIYDLKNGIFASSYSEYQNQGGVYYADFMFSNLSYYPYMSIRENHFFLELVDYPFKNSQEEGVINQTIEMNALGLLENMAQKATNLSSGKTSSLQVDVKYNCEITRKANL